MQYSSCEPRGWEGMWSDRQWHMDDAIYFTVFITGLRVLRINYFRVDFHSLFPNIAQKSSSLGFFRNRQCLLCSVGIVLSRFSGGFLSSQLFSSPLPFSIISILSHCHLHSSLCLSGLCGLYVSVGWPCSLIILSDSIFSGSTSNIILISSLFLINCAEPKGPE